MSNTIKIGGVGEHFNLPIHLAIEQGEFKQRGIDVEWTTFHGGTGQMTRALRNDDVDICILLTEGIVTDIIKGNPSKIISEYVTTPLNWGIHTGANNPIKHYEEIFDKNYAISRLGSGSHLMAIVDANSKGKSIQENQFNVISNLDGAIESLTNLETDIFYWEKFTTKPFVDNGQLKRIGECFTPWPCFVIAATDRILKEQKEDVIRVLRTIHDSCDAFMQNENAVPLVQKRYHQLPKDVERWYYNTEWAIHGWVRNKMLKSVIYNLQISGIIDSDVEVPNLIWKRGD